MKAPPALKERVTDGAGRPAGPGLRWAGGAFGRINPTASAEPMILPFVNWQGLAWRGSHRKPALLPRPSTLPWSIATPETVQADSFTPEAILLLHILVYSLSEVMTAVNVYLLF